MKKTLFTVFIVLAFTIVASADVYVKTNIHTDAMSIMGQEQPASDEVSEQWIGDDMYALHGKSQSMIVNLGKNLMYIINHDDKSYIESTVPLDFSKLLPAEMAQMASMMKMTVTVNPTTETKTIGKWKCTGYDVTMSMMMMPLKMKVWASTDVPVDMNKYFDKIFSNVMTISMRLDENALKEMKKVKGFWISTETTGDIMGAKLRSTQDVDEISTKSPGPDVYSVPAGYTKKDKLSSDFFQRR